MSFRVALVGIILILVALLAWLFFAEVASAPVAPASIPAATTTEPTSTAASSSAPLSARVSVAFPQANATVGSTFEVQGSAPGGWFFEAQFPVQVRDQNGNVIGSSPATTSEEWTTNSIIHFSANLTLDPSYHGPATLILMKDNPSGLPQNDDAISIPINVR